MNCPKCSAAVERVWTGKKTVMVEPGRLTVYVPAPGDNGHIVDVFVKSVNGRVAHRCRVALAAVEAEPGREEATSAAAQS